MRALSLSLSLSLSPPFPPFYSPRATLFFIQISLFRSFPPFFFFFREENQRFSPYSSRRPCTAYCLSSFLFVTSSQLANIADQQSEDKLKSSLKTNAKGKYCYREWLRWLIMRWVRSRFASWRFNEWGIWGMIYRRSFAWRLIKIYSHQIWTTARSAR